jgi:iron complex outermembrane recepter protein
MLKGSWTFLGASLTAVAACAAVAPAHAAEAQGAAAAPEAAATTEPSLQDIVVTASRRAVSLQRESRSITAISAADLQRDGVTSPTTIANLAPGLTISTNGPQLQVSIRGVGDRTVNGSTDPAVAMNIDGFYFPKTYEATAAFFDLDRIEVLKGPQGTLYGRNASSGAINLIVAKPKFEIGGYGEVEYGNYDNIRGEAAINLPLSDTLAFRLSGQVQRRDGYLTDGYNDDRHEAVRAQLLYRQDDTSVLLTGFYSHLGGKGNAAVIAERFGGTPSTSTVPVPADPWAGPSDPATQARIAATNPGSQALARGDGFQQVETYAVTADFEHTFSWGRLSILPSYVGSDYKTLSYAALLVPLYEPTVSNQYALEARLSSLESSRIKWVAGLFGAIENSSDGEQAQVATTYNVVYDAPKRLDKTWAAFGEINASVTDRFRLVGGLRYTWEQKHVVGSTAGVFGAITTFPETFSTPVADMAGAEDISGQRTDQAVNFRAGVEYDLAPAVMGYASVATGFKAGGFYNDVAPNNSYRPEHLTAYTVGVKSRFLSNRLQLNLEGFYWDYKDKQESYLGYGSIPGSVILLTQNASSARLYGFDASLAAQITPTTRISGETEYNNTRYGTYVVDTLTGVIDNSGRPLVRAPLWSGHVAFDQGLPLGKLGDLAFNAQMRFSSSYWLSNDFVALGYQTPYAIYDASLTWTAPDKRYTVTAYMRNIGNRAYYTGGIYSSALTDAFVAQIDDPRTYGVRFRMSF